MGSALRRNAEGVSAELQELAWPRKRLEPGSILFAEHEQGWDKAVAFSRVAAVGDLVGALPSIATKARHASTSNCTAHIMEESRPLNVFRANT